MYRTCRRCGETKPLTAFAIHPTNRGQRIMVCGTCRGKHMSAALTGKTERLFDGWSRIPAPVESSVAYKARIKARLLAARGAHS